MAIFMNWSQRVTQVLLALLTVGVWSLVLKPNLPFVISTAKAAAAPPSSTFDGDWEVARRLGRVPYPCSQENVRFFSEHVVPNEPTWAIVLRQTDELVGVVSLVPHGESQCAELSYYLGRSHWGEGLVTETVEVRINTIVAFKLPFVG